MTGRIYSELPKKTLEINSCLCAFCQHTIQITAKSSSFPSWTNGLWAAAREEQRICPCHCRKHLVVIPLHCSGVCWWQQRNTTAAGSDAEADPALQTKSQLWQDLRWLYQARVLAQLLELLLLSLHKNWPRNSRSPVKSLLLHELWVHWLILKNAFLRAAMTLWF